MLFTSRESLFRRLDAPLSGEDVIVSLELLLGNRFISIRALQYWWSIQQDSRFLAVVPPRLIEQVLCDEGNILRDCRHEFGYLVVLNKSRPPAFSSHRRLLVAVVRK